MPQTTRAARPGYLAERIGCLYLQCHALKLIARNFRGPRGEIDLIMVQEAQGRERCVVFVEVRLRRHEQFGGPDASISLRKRLRIQRTASLFLQKYPLYAEYNCRFDALLFTSFFRITWLKDIDSIII